MTARMLCGPRDWEHLSSAEARALIESAGATRQVVRSGDAFAVWGDEPFDSHHFGLTMGKVFGMFGEAADAYPLIAGVCAEADAQGFDHLAVRLPSQNPSLVRASEKAGFFFVDSHTLLSTTRLDYRSSSTVEVDRVRPEDVPAIQEMSRTIFESSRYMWDPMLSEAGRWSLQDAWIANDCAKRADLCLVCRLDGRPIGYNLCLWSEEAKAATIDLIAVSPEAQGKGVGQALIAAAFAHYEGRANIFYVGTQGSNQGGHRLYRRCGFTLIANDMSMHRHRGGVIP